MISEKFQGVTVLFAIIVGVLMMVGWTSIERVKWIRKYAPFCTSVWFITATLFLFITATLYLAGVK